MPPQAVGREHFDVDAKTVGDALDSLLAADLLFNERREEGPLKVSADGTDARGRGGLGGSLTSAGEVRIVRHSSYG